MRQNLVLPYAKFSYKVTQGTYAQRCKASVDLANMVCDKIADRVKNK